MQRFKKILFVVEPDVDTSTALKRAIAFAINNQASLSMISVVKELPLNRNMAIVAVTPAELMDSVVAETQDQLADMANDATSDDGLQISINVLVGRPFLEIIREVIRNDHDLVIKSTGKHERFKEILFSSTDMHLMRKCPCPVWIIKPADHEHYHRVLAAVDHDLEDSATDTLNQQILEMSSSLAISEFSELHIVHVWRLVHEDHLRSPRLGYADVDVDAMAQEEEDERRRWLEHLVDTFGGPSAIEYLGPELHLKNGDPRSEVPRLARELDVDLVVMGTLGRIGIPGFFMGNTAEEILEQLDCSVLAIKPPGFLSPVSAT